MRCVVITGAGREFCAGIDMAGGANPDAPPPVDDKPDPEGRRLNMRNEVEAFIALRRLEVPVIAALNGPAVDALLVIIPILVSQAS